MRQDQNGTMFALIARNTIGQFSANGIYLQAQDNAPKTMPIGNSTRP